MKFVIRWLLSSLSLVLVSYLFKDIGFESFSIVLIVALMLGILNATLRPLLLILTLPVNILSLGLFTFLINALMFWIVYLIVPGFWLTNFMAGFWAALIFMIINWFLNMSILDEEKD